MTVYYHGSVSDIAFLSLRNYISIVNEPLRF